MDSYERGSLRFPVRDAGPQNGPAVVLLHGFPQDDSSYDRVLPFLHEAGLRTLVPLQRGYAASARPTHRRDYRTSELVQDVRGLLDASGVKQAHLVGHDWGGAVAWATAATHPDRIRSLTVLSTPHPAAFLDSMFRSGQARKSGYMALFQLPWVPEAMLSTSLPRTLIRTGLPSQDAHRYGRQMLEPGTATGALNWYRALPWARSSDTGTIAVPTTYLWGRRDFALGRFAAERTAKYVAADYRFIEAEAGHWLPESHPSAVADAILGRIRADA